MGRAANETTEANVLAGLHLPRKNQAWWTTGNRHPSHANAAL